MAMLAVTDDARVRLLTVNPPEAHNTVHDQLSHHAAPGPRATHAEPARPGTRRRRPGRRG